jgi:hypothetical protein
MPDVERVCHHEQDRQGHLQVEGQRYDTGPGTQGEEANEIDHIPLAEPFVDHHVIVALPTTPKT